jgi:hypothetical protein
MVYCSRHLVLVYCSVLLEFFFGNKTYLMLEVLSLAAFLPVYAIQGKSNSNSFFS